ncbi:streptothricin acetyltransferase [Duganella sp. CF458]|uniref:GNAT family N-acetyltransferase n=1 Tax=Duganella sp. CF458 TaxID=1884368 RepID=UPI0008F443FE|nr:GNAT family N-acetyltransferase [Duganella sp. CF458]SFG83827.1 streptothricin acetyltransferase [Duganella sp. CF458]
MKIVRLEEAASGPLDCEENAFTSSEVFDILLVDGKIRLTARNVEQFTKTYAAEEAPTEDVESYGAFVNGALAGKIDLTTAWNDLGSIEQIVVARGLRQHGIATGLIDFAKSWAVGKQLKGLRLETQTNNVAACKLYLRNGFEIGGFDRFVYRTQEEVANETALYWYWFPERQNSKNN